MSILVGATSGLAGAAGASGSSADLGDTIDQSLRFRGSQHLTRTFSSTGNRRSFTISCWVKFPTAGSFKLMNIGSDGNNCNTWEFNNANGQLKYEEVNGGSFTTYGLSDNNFRDPAAWYHLMFVADTANATANDRIQIYVNSLEIDMSQQAGTWPVSQNYDFDINTNVAHSIGAYTGGSSLGQAYLAEYIFVDGSSLSPTDFGRTNDDGVWVPQDYTGSYGTNGFHLKFDSSGYNGSGGIGADHSGNGNDFTATGFETTAISSSNFDNDIDYEDTPTSNYATGNPLHPHSTSSWSKANLTVANPQDSYFRGNFQLPSSGKFYWEINNDGDGSSNAQAVVYGITNPGGPDTNNLVSSAFWRNASGFDGTAAVAVDMDAGEIWFAENNTWASGDPSAGTSPSHTDLLTAYDPVEWFPLFGGYRAVNYSINFGQMDFQYTPPTGFSALQTNNLPEPTIKNGKAQFQAVTWSGDGTSPRTISTQFEPDFVWIKSRSNATSHFLYDSVRGFGANKELVADTNNEEGNTGSPATDANGYVSDTTGGASPGFILTTGTTGDAYTNDSGRTYVGYCWKAGGTAVSNTNGSITSSVSANTDAGFSIVSWQRGTNTTATIGHGLSEAPEFMIVKARGVQENWSVYHAGYGNTVRFKLNDNAYFDSSSQYWNNTSPTNSVFTVGNGINTNQTGDMIAYCWHSVEGFSKFDSYDGNSSSNGVFIYTGFKPAWLLIKRATANGNWHLFDTTRSPFNPIGETLYTDLAFAEQDVNYVDIVSNGFKLRTNDGGVNLGSVYIYMAFAENPFGGENAPPATAR